jgi:predicted alpha/beta superfamily hydrolase
MPSPTLASATRFDITSKSTGRSYSISLHRPSALPLKGPFQNCPILFVLDGDLAFGTAVESAALRTVVGQLEPAIIVGVAYDSDLLTMVRLRTKDLTPPAPEGKYPEMAGMIGTEYGGADAFLEFLIDELAPEIRTRAPEASKTRLSIFGHSLGGLFVAYALMRRPEAFETFLANSPALWWNDFAVLAFMRDFPEKIKRLSARPRVLIGVGALEQKEPTVAPPGVELEAMKARVREAKMVDAAREFADALRDAKLAELRFVEFDGEDHGSVLAAAVGRAISFTLRKS